MKLQYGLGVGLLIAGLTACNGPPGAPSASDVQTPAAAVATTVASGTPAAVATAIAEGTPQAAVQAALGPAVAGTVQAVNGTTITVQPRQQGAAPMTVELTTNTAIQKQVVRAITDLKVGA